jgi:hypothetical protein
MIGMEDYVKIRRSKPDVKDMIDFWRFFGDFRRFFWRFLAIFGKQIGVFRENIFAIT